MATLSVSQKWKYAQQVEKELHSELKSKDRLPRFEDVDNLINELRIACETTIFLDFEYATKEEVERRLWTAHSVIKDRYKKMVTHYREKEPRKHVERRKVEQRYADFIKTTQYFYRGYIQRLASHFSGLRGLRRIAHRLSLDCLTVDERVKVSPRIEDLIEKSCHATLLRLGDLSRYRNELRTKDRSWEPALGYYSLAGDLCPDSGSSHNQMAVISLAEVNHLDALYHLHRAIAVKQPHPLAEGNLGLEFRKITTAWEKNKPTNTMGDNEATLVLWFVRLHAKFYAGLKFAGHEELENTVLSRLVLLLKGQSFESTLRKLVLINIAAEYFAGERVKKEGLGVSEETLASFYFFLRFNVRFLHTLLQTLQTQVELQKPGEDLPGGKGKSQSDSSLENITAIARRVLPAIRQYGIWLLAQAPIIVNSIHTEPISRYIKEMLRMYTDVITRVIRFFPVVDLPVLDYLLEEDEITVGFKPFRDPSLVLGIDLYADENEPLKPRSTDAGIERSHPNVEMRSRIRDIILCALVLREGNEPMIHLDTESLEFSFVEESLQPTGLSHAEGAGNDQTSPGRGSNSAKAPEPVPSRSPVAIDTTNTEAPDLHQGMDTDMHRMVDSLLEPSLGAQSESNEMSYGMHSRTANEIFAPIGNGGYQPPNISTPNMLPSLPGIWNSPFAPRPDELALHSPGRLSASRQLSPRQPATPGQRFSPVGALDGVAAYGRPPTADLQGKKDSKPPSKPTSQAVNSILQESLSQQFMPTQRSTFSESSSIYANTPRGQPLSGALTLPNGLFPTNNTTVYAGASDFDKNTMLQSSVWYNSETGWGNHLQTPPGGQGG